MPPWRPRSPSGRVHAAEPEPGRWRDVSRVRPLARARRLPRRRRRPRRAARPACEGRGLRRPRRRPRRASRARSKPHGRVEDLEVAGQRVGVRLYPRDRAARALAPAGIEFAPPRTERSTGPGPPRLRHRRRRLGPARGRHGAPRLHRQRDGAQPRRRTSSSTRSAGAADLERGVLRTVSADELPRTIPLRIVRGLRLVSQLGLEPDADTLAQMREHAAQVGLVSGERIGGGLQADAAGELSKLLLGAEPATRAAARTRHGRSDRDRPGVRAVARLRHGERAAA